MKWGSRPDMNTIAVGDEVSVPMNCLHDEERRKAKVIYVHPKRRFFTVCFEETGIHESYCMHGPLT